VMQLMSSCLGLKKREISASLLAHVARKELTFFIINDISHL